MIEEEKPVFVADPDQVKSIAGAIRRYLASCPEAAETVEGVARWWLTRQRYADALNTVQHALDVLESEGQVERIQSGSGNVMYRKVRRLN